MKKYLFVLLISIMIVPSVALASWWNPFSWNIFHKKEVPQTTQTIDNETVKTPEEKNEKKIPENEINELELQKIRDVLKTMDLDNKTLKSDSTEIKIACNEKLYDDICTPKGLKTFCGPEKMYCDTQEHINNYKICNGVTYNIICSSGSKFTCPLEGVAYCQLIDTKSFIDTTSTNKNTTTDYQKKKEEMKNSQECKEATSSLEEIRTEIKKLNEKQRKYDIKDTDSYSETSDKFLKSLEIDTQLYKLSNESNSILIDQIRFCDGIAIIPDLPKTYNTNCTTGAFGSINCTTR